MTILQNKDQKTTQKFSINYNLEIPENLTPEELKNLLEIMENTIKTKVCN